MKKIISFLLILLIIFSIINIQKINASEPIFIIENVSITNKSSGVEVTINDFGINSIDVNTTYHHINDYVEYKIVFKNTSDNEYKLAIIDDNHSSNYVTYEYSYDNNKKLNKNDTIEVVLKTTYKTEVNNISERNELSNVLLNLSLENVDGEIILNNPNTKDSLYIYIRVTIHSYIYIKLKS